MLQAFIDNKWIPIIDKTKYYIEYQYGGQHLLSFSLPLTSELKNKLMEEVQVKEDKENLFIIKKIKQIGNYIDYQCELSFDEFKNRLYKSTKDLEQFKTKLLSQILDTIVPHGWKVINSSIRDIRRTIELEGATDYDVLFKCAEVFDVVYDINILEKTIIVIDPESFKYDGLYIHRDLNLSSYSMTGDSTNMITRLYCEGKDSLTFSSINNGKDYIENTEYKNTIISAFWKDERYTNADELLKDAKKKLNDLSIPKRSYVFSVIDLAAVNKEYDFLSMSLYKLVKVIVDENITIMNKVVKYRKFFNESDVNKNIVTLSNEPQTINSKINNALGGSINNILQGSFLQQAQKEAAAILNEFATKGHRYETENETYFLDQLPKEKARYVMRQNLGGIAFSQSGWQGPYITAWTIDGGFNADFITVGTLRAIKLVGNDIIGGTMNINNNFIVDAYGNFKCTNGDLDGKITSTSGNIGGWIVDSNGFRNDKAKIDKSGITNIYTWADLYIVRLIIVGTVVADDDMILHYDFNGDGQITPVDYMILKQKLKAL